MCYAVGMKGIFPPKKRQESWISLEIFLKKSPSAGHVLVGGFWGQCSGLNESKKIVARWKIRFGARTALHTTELMLPLPVFFWCLFFSRLDRDWKERASKIDFFGGVCCSDFKKSTLILLTLSKTCFKESKCRCMQWKMSLLKLCRQNHLQDKRVNNSLLLPLQWWQAGGTLTNPVQPARPSTNAKTNW